MVAYFFIALAILIPRSFVSASILINEISWMGTVPKEGESAQAAANNEWLELHNSSASAVSVDGWALSAADGGMTIGLSGSISAGGYYLIERTDDNTVPNIAADLVTPFGNGLNNTVGELLILKDGAGNEINRVDASGGWPAGNNFTKETMQRVGSSWVTASATPRASNSGSLPPAPAPPPNSPSAPEPESEPASSPADGPAPVPYLESASTVPSEPAPAATSIQPLPSESESSPPIIPPPAPASSPAEKPVSQIQAETAPNLPAVVETVKTETPQSSAEFSSQLVKDSLASENNQELKSQTALLVESSPEDQLSIFSSSWFWFGIAAVLGVLSVGGVFVMRKLIW